MARQETKQSATAKARKSSAKSIMSLNSAVLGQHDVLPACKSSHRDGGTEGRSTTSSNTTLSPSEHEDLRHAFALFDIEQKGEIYIGELRSILQELHDDNSSTSSPVLQNLLSSLDRMPSSQRLSLDDFIRLLTTPNQADTRDEWEKVFDLFDESGKGYINVDDLKNTAKCLGEMMEDDELRAMVYLVEKSGRVTLEKFKDIMNKKLFY